MRNFINEIMTVRPRRAPRGAPGGAPGGANNAIATLNSRGFTKEAPTPVSDTSWAGTQNRLREEANAYVGGPDAANAYTLADGTVYMGDRINKDGYVTGGEYIAPSGGVSTRSMAVGQSTASAGGGASDEALDAEVQRILTEYNNRLDLGVDPAAAAGVAGIPLTDSSGRPMNFRLLAQDPRQLKQALARGMYRKTDGRKNR